MKKWNLKNAFKYFIGFCALAMFTNLVFAYNLVLDGDLMDTFDNLEEQYTETLFTENGNEFAGLVFWQDDILLDNEEPVNLANTTVELSCQYQLRGLYYNPQRWNMLRPLDQESLDLLRTIDTNWEYNSVAVDGWLYKWCNWDDDTYIYGQVTNSRNGLEYKVVAGVEYSGNNYIQEFAENAKWLESNNVWIGFMRDSWGWVFKSIYVNENIVDSFYFPTEKNADLDEYYKSDEIEIDWLADNVQVLAYLWEFSKGVMFINGGFVWKTGYVENGDEIEIELKSSDDYDEIVSTTLYIWKKSATYYIMTKSRFYDDDDDDYELSVSEQLRIILTFKEIVDSYGANTAKLDDFLYTFKSMLEDELDLEDDVEEKEKLQYLLEVIDSYLMENMLNNVWDLPFGDTDVYIAPNCKSYEIEYNTDRQAYYSPNFVYMHYFVSREALERYVDERNLWNGNCSTVINNDNDRTTRVAPNGKVYQIEKTNQGYISYDFIVKTNYFDSIEAIRKYIDVNNPVMEVRDHSVDDEFEPVIYIAPNGKDYEILKTDRWYMSYRFIFVKYFNTIDSIKEYIDANNPE